ARSCSPTRALGSWRRRPRRRCRCHRVRRPTMGTTEADPRRAMPLHSLFDLTGRTAIVTGGSRGLGLEMAEGLGEAGAQLVICARREEWLAPAVASLRGR